MGQCKLSEHQRDLLRLVAQGLRDRPGPVQWWLRIGHDHGIPVWQNVEDDDLRDQLQQRIVLGDIAMFECCGFITNPQPGRYNIVARRIIEAVESDFFDTDGSDHKPRRHKRRSRGGKKKK